MTGTTASDADREVGWDEGENYYGAWIGYVFFLVISTFLNTATLALIARSRKLRRMRMTKGVLFLNVQDWVFSASCMIQCTLALAGHSIAGREIGCAYQAIHHTFLTLATSHTLCIMSYMNHQNLVNRTVYSYFEVFKLHLVPWTFDVLITILVCVYPGEVIIQSSGTFCMPNVSNAYGFTLFFGIGVGSAAVFLLHRFSLIYGFITEHTRQLQSVQKTDASANRMVKQVHAMAVRIAILIGAFLFCSSVFLAASVYELASGTMAPPAVMITAVFFIHGNSTLNPVLYFWMSNSAREAAREALGCPARSPAKSGTGGATTTGSACDKTRTSRRIESKVESGCDASKADSGVEMQPVRLQIKTGGGLGAPARGAAEAPLTPNVIENTPPASPMAAPRGAATSSAPGSPRVTARAENPVESQKL